MSEKTTIPKEYKTKEELMKRLEEIFLERAKEYHSKEQKKKLKRKKPAPIPFEREIEIKL